MLESCHSPQRKHHFLSQKSIRSVLSLQIWVLQQDVFNLHPYVQTLDWVHRNSDFAKKASSKLPSAAIVTHNEGNIAILLRLGKAWVRWMGCMGFEPEFMNIMYSTTALSTRFSMVVSWTASAQSRIPLSSWTRQDFILISRSKYVTTRGSKWAVENSPSIFFEYPNLDTSTLANFELSHYCIQLETRFLSGL